jgi:hypothetical protein
MKPKPFSALNHLAVHAAMSHAFQPMYASRNMRKAEVIALVPAAQQNAHAEDVVEGELPHHGN